METKKTVDYYGSDDNYIHLKFGEARKMYNFTDEFVKKYPNFSREYTNYWDGKESAFRSPFAIVEYVFSNEIPVHFYYNFTDEPATDKEDIIQYLVRENSCAYNLKD